MNNTAIITDDSKNTHHLAELTTWCEQSTIDWQASAIKSDFYTAMVDVGKDIELCVEVGGNPNNPALVMIMGLGSQMIFWPDEFLDGLVAAGFFVIRFDNRDSGLSTKIKMTNFKSPPLVKMIGRMQVGLSNHQETVPYTLVDMANDVYRLIQVLGRYKDETSNNIQSNESRKTTQKVTLLGASMGGIISQILAATYPDMVDNLVLMFSTTNRAMLLPPKPAQLNALFKPPKSRSEKDMVDHSIWFVNTVGSPGHIDEEQVKRVATLRYQRNSSPIGSTQQFFAILATGSVKDYAEKISAPTLVIHGSKDGLIPYQNGRDVARTIKGAKFELVDGMGHDIPKYFHAHLIKKIAQHCFD